MTRGMAGTDWHAHDAHAPPPGPGEHNQLVYGELLGDDESQIAALRAQGVI